MTRYCGTEAVVRQRVARMINERTAEMQELPNAVTLWHGPPNERLKLDAECMCYRELGDCPRGELMYWREIWLEPIGDEARRSTHAHTARARRTRTRSERRARRPQEP